MNPDQEIDKLIAKADALKPRPDDPAWVEAVARADGDRRRVARGTKDGIYHVLNQPDNVPDWVLR